MELTPRLQDIVSLLKERKEMDIKDLALELRISPKTAKGYVRELNRLGYVDIIDEKVVFKTDSPSFSEDIKKILEIHEAEISNLKKEVDALKEEIIKLRKSRG